MWSWCFHPDCGSYGKIKKMSNPSILSAIIKLTTLLTSREKFKWLTIIIFALTNSVLELLTAVVIVIFAQVLNLPEAGTKYLVMMGLETDIGANKILLYAAIMVGSVYLLKNLFAAGEVFHQNFAIQKMNSSFKNKLLYKYSELHYGFYLTRNSSFPSNVISGDTEMMFSSGMAAIAIILTEAIVFLTLISLIIYMNPALALIIFLVFGAISLFIIKFVLPHFYEFGRSLQVSAVHNAQHLSQFFHAFKEIVLIGKKTFFIEAYKVHSEKKSQIQALQTSFNAMPRIVIEILFIGAFVGTISYFCFSQEGTTEMMGVLGGYLYAGFRLMPSLNRIISQLNIFKSVIPSIERVFEEYNMTTSKESYVDCNDLELLNGIEVKNVSFRYMGCDNYALDNVSLEIKKGQYVGIVGTTGSGKSTLMDIILGLLKPTNGSVLIDDKYPVNSYQWHKKIGYVPQSIYLTDDTIARNIAFGEVDVDQKKLDFAINAAQLKDLIEGLPNKIDTFVGERGIRLSGGERQRIAIARALYHLPEVLLFDEATSALDNETEANLMETINQISKDRTVIMIAHRISTLKNCDKIFVVEKGTIKKVTDYKNLYEGVRENE